MHTLLRRCTNEGSREERKCLLPRTPSSYCIWAVVHPTRLVAKIAWRKGRHQVQATRKVESNWIYTGEESCLSVFSVGSFSSEHHNCASWVSSWVPAWDPDPWPFPMPQGLPKNFFHPPQSSLHPRQRSATGLGVQPQGGKGKWSLPLPKYRQGLEWELWPLRYRQTQAKEREHHKNPWHRHPKAIRQKWVPFWVLAEAERADVLFVGMGSSTPAE